MPNAIEIGYYNNPIGRKKARREDDEMYVPQRRAAVVEQNGQPAGGFGAPARPRAGGLPDVVKDQVIEQNMIRRQGNFEREQVDQAQVRRRGAAIHQATKLAGRGGAIPPAGRPAIPIVQPAPQQQQGQGQRPLPDPNGLGAAVGTMERIGQQPTAFAGASLNEFPATPGELARSRSTSPGTPENDARLLASPDPTISGPMQDAQGINQRMALLAQNPGMDVGQMQRNQQVQAANAAMTRPPLAPLPALPPGRAGAGQTVPGQGTLEQRLAILAQSSGDPRLAALIGQMNAGQTALDSGSSLERQQFDAQQAAQRQHELSMAKAQNPPRPAPGPATHPKVKSPVELAIDAMNAIPAQIQNADGQWVSNPQFEDAYNRFKELSKQQPAGTPAPAAQPTPSPQPFSGDGKTLQKGADAMRQPAGEEQAPPGMVPSGRLIVEDKSGKRFYYDPKTKELTPI